MVFLIHYSCSQRRREQEFKHFPKLKKFWNVIKKKWKSADEATRAKNEFDSKFLYNLIQFFFDILKSIPSQGNTEDLALHPLISNLILKLLQSETELSLPILCSQATFNIFFLRSKEKAGQTRNG